MGKGVGGWGDRRQAPQARAVSPPGDRTPGPASSPCHLTQTFLSLCSRCPSRLPTLGSVLVLSWATVTTRPFILLPLISQPYSPVPEDKHTS